MPIYEMETEKVFIRAESKEDAEKAFTQLVKNGEIEIDTDQLPDEEEEDFDEEGEEFFDAEEIVYDDDTKEGNKQ